MDKKEIITYLKDFVSLLEIAGENEFKLKAYRNAIRTFEYIKDEDFLMFLKNKNIEKIKGIGKKISNNLYELYEEGNIREFEDLKRSIPQGVLMMLKIPGIGPKKVKKIYEELNITNLKDLKEAVINGEISKLKGFGKKIGEKILNGIDFILKNEGLFRFDVGLTLGVSFKNLLKSIDGVEDVFFSGRLRRFDNTLDKIDLILVPGTKNLGEIGNKIKNLADVYEILNFSEHNITFLSSDGFKIDVKIVFPEKLPYGLLFFTGSDRHVEKLNKILRAKNYKLSKDCLTSSNNDYILCNNEGDIYLKTGFKSFIPPELREDMGELEFALNRRIPELVKPGDIKGVIHLHTTYSDGKNSILEMAQRARELGYKYMVVTDHSKSAFYANGLDENRVLKQFKEIEKLNSEFSDFKILKGIEVDILKDGSLDYGDDILSQFDIVIASVHSSFSMNKEEMTGRLVKAIENKYVDILGHPTGRLILKRDGYALDMETILEALMKNKKSVEINANPHRLDLDWRFVKRAIDMGVLLSINPDAHNLNGIEDIFYGVNVARKGWAKKEDILNCFEVNELLDWKKRRILS